ncbi:DegV family protein [Paenibacillus campi]|uniref:DegV family protein n=1 Tax=Paenibacillus campi TaxID=3106031 RepID=UPI002AFF738F|nr:DegV family protein [Paenibacillus sp. SGZ-1009]
MAYPIIVTESTADIPAELIQAYAIQIIPLRLFFGQDSYADGVDITSAQFYERLAAAAQLPTTSQPSPADYAAMYERLLHEHPDSQIISIHLSSGLSGTYQSATIGRSMVEQEERITIIDSLSASYGYGMAVVHAARLARQGASVADIQASVARLLAGRELYFLVDDLEYLRKGGRIGRASATLGTLLNVKPILSIDEHGVIYPVEKVRGQKKAMARIVDMLRQKLTVRKIHLALGHTANRASCEPLLQMLREHYEITELVYSEIGPVIGTHTGAGTIAVYAWPDEE